MKNRRRVKQYIAPSACDSADVVRTLEKVVCRRQAAEGGREESRFVKSSPFACGRGSRYLC
jgi:hypothetical protein